MADKVSEFIDRFRDYMKPSGQEQPLFRFLDGLGFDELRDCATAYFREVDQYPHQRTKSAHAFLRLATDLVGTGDLYFGLRLEIMLRTPNLSWAIHNAALTPSDKFALQKRIQRKTALLTPAQRQFINLFDRCMKGAVRQNGVETFTSRFTSFEPRRDFLFTYVEVSQGYDGRNKDPSLVIFLGLSRAAIARGEPVFAHVYQARVAERDSPWFERYQALAPDLRGLLEQDLKQKLTIRSAVEVKLKGKTYTGTEVGHYKFDPVPASKQYAEDREKRAPPTALQRQFLGFYKKYVATGGRAPIAALNEFVQVHSGADLQACVEAYLGDSTYRQTDDNPRSLEVFFGILFMALQKSSAYYAVKAKTLINLAGNIWNKRYAALDKLTYRDRLDAQIAERIETARLIDDVRAAYYAARRSDPDSRTVQTFSPATDRALEERVSKALSNCEVAIAAKSVERFEAAFADLAAALGGAKEPLVLLALIRRCRERPRLDVRFQHLFYLYGVGLLFIALVHSRPVVYQAGFDAEERAWLLTEPDRRDRYFSDFALQLEYVMLKRSGSPTLTALCMAQGSLYLYADRYRIQLTPTLEAGALLGCVETLWEKRGQEVAALRIPITSRRDGSKQLRIAQTIGNFYILWWDFTHETVYLHINGFDRVVFETGQARLAEIYDDDALYGEIWRSTQHILELMPVFWQVIMYLPDLVSGGLTGLVKSIVFNYAFEKSTEALGVDPTKAQVLMVGFGLLAHGLMPKQGGARKVKAAIETAEGNVARDVRATAVHNQMADARITGPSGGEPALQRLESDVGIDMRGVQRGDFIEIRGHDPSHPVESHIGDDMRGVQRGEFIEIGEERGEAHPNTDSRGQGSKSHGTETHQKDARTIDPEDRGTAATRDDPNASPRGDANKDVPAPPETLKVGEGISGVGEAPPRPPVPGRNHGPLEPRCRDRRTMGRWSQDGEVNINRDGYAFERPSQKRAKDWREYEQGFNEQIVEELAADISNKNVRVLGPENPEFGYESRLDTNRLQLQRGMREPQGPVTRIPDASMGVFEKVGGGKTMTEKHFFEATLQSDFRISTGATGRKQRQIIGTLWTQMRKKTGPNTRLYYHIITPRPPSSATVTFLNEVVREIPHLEINWYVVPP